VLVSITMDAFWLFHLRAKAFSTLTVLISPCQICHRSNKFDGMKFRHMKSNCQQQIEQQRRRRNKERERERERKSVWKKERKRNIVEDLSLFFLSFFSFLFVSYLVLVDPFDLLFSTITVKDWQFLSNHLAHVYIFLSFFLSFFPLSLLFLFTLFPFLSFLFSFFSLFPSFHSLY
jgi:hypothetical protein